MQQSQIRSPLTSQQIIDRIKPMLLSTQYQPGRLENLAKIPLAADVCLCWYADLSDLPLPGEIPADSMPSAPITTDLARRLGLSLEALEVLGQQHASYNCRPMAQVMRAFCPDILADGDPEDAAPGLMVLTNDSSWRGAAAILNPEIQTQLESALGPNYYILLSSVHEALAVPQAATDADYLGHMVCEINATQVSPEERLSDHVFTITDGKLTVVI